VGLFELPDDDERGADLDQGVQPEPGQGDRGGGERRGDHHDRPHHVPAQRGVFEHEAPAQQNDLSLGAGSRSFGPKKPARG
jgi:hypothetical protein